MDEPKMKKSSMPFLRQCLVTASVCLNIMGQGGVSGFSATLIPSLRKPESHIKPTVIEESYIASILGLGLIVGNVIMTWLMGAQGRKVCHIINLLPSLIGWIIIFLANNVASLIVARVLQGIAMGLMGPIGSVIIAEMTDPVNRGAFLSMVSLSLSAGVFFGHTIGTYVSWQRTALILSLMPLVSLILVIYCPESPSYLISKGRYEDATRILYWLRGESDDVEEELESMISNQNSIKKSSTAGQKLSLCVRISKGFRSLRVMFRKPEFYKPVLIMFMLGLTYQFSGINVINAYSLDIIRQVIGAEEKASILMVGMDILRLIANVIAVLVAGKLNRRTLLFFSGLSCVVCYFIKAAYVYAKANNTVPSAIAGPLFPIIVLGAFVSFSIGLTVIPLTVIGEIFPLEYRNMGCSIGAIPWSLNMFMAVNFFPVLIMHVGLPLTYVIYGAVVLGCLGYLYFLMPETRGRTLLEIEDTFKGVPLADRKASVPLTGKFNREETLRRNSSIVLY